MEKLLHERLREWTIGKHVEETVNEYYGCSDIEGLLNEIADEVERYYIPRPRFDDGQPVQWEDELENGEPLYCVAFDSDGECSINALCKNEDYTLFQDETLKRPTQKVLDADGVEIKVGDTVWEIDSCQKEIIKEVNSLFMCTTESGTCPHPKNLTHREPDSLEKVQQFAKEWSYMDNVSNSSAGDFRDAMQEVADRLTAIMERDA